MAAGIGSRYGRNIKQLAPVGPCGEVLMEYSVHDALAAGFNRIVFILRSDLKEEFYETVGKNVERVARVEYVIQEQENIPEGFSVPEGRQKPWGTGQAVLCCEDVVKTPLTVINADDYYGRKSFVKMHDFLISEDFDTDGPERICMAGFRLANTLSDNGSVTRGICRIGDDGKLISIRETKNIVRKGHDAEVIREDGGRLFVPGDSRVSMNMWGFGNGFISMLKKGFQDFLNGGHDLIQDEFLLPSFIDELLQNGKVEVNVFDTDEQWFGVTYAEDRAAVVQALEALVRDGLYGKDLYADRIG